MGQRVRQGFQNTRAQQTLAGRAAAGLPAHVRAQQRERELTGEQFVIGEPRPGQALGCNVVRLGRAMQMAQRLGECRETLARQPGFVLPFRQIGQTGERTVHRAPNIAGGQPFGERIDRLDQRQIGEAFFVHDAVGMHHLQHVVVDLGGAGDVTHLALWQELAQIVLARVEKGQRQRLAGVVAGDDAVRRARPVARNRPVFVDRHRDGDDLAGLHLVEFRPRPAVDDARRQMKQQIDYARCLAVEQPGIEQLQLRPDAGQAG